MKKMRQISRVLTVFILGLLVGWLYAVLTSQGPDIIESAAITGSGPQLITHSYKVEPNSTFSQTMNEIDFTDKEIQEIVTNTKPVYNLGRIKSGTPFEVLQEVSEQAPFVGLNFKLSSTDTLVIQKVDGQWKAKIDKEEIHVKQVTFQGTVESSLWNSATSAQMDSNLIIDLAEIFAWQVDFSRDVREGDRWRLVAEQKFVKGKPIGWGAILAAEYVRQDETYTATLLRIDGEELGYFAPDGGSLKKMFLKSPIKFGHITSRMSRKRFHPILQTFKAHKGVDYGAPVGTPVRSVGDGLVTFAARQGGYGNVIRIRHNGTYTTAYAHLSRFGSQLRVGKRVTQGQVIGYVGNTGLSTGPHLHFEFWQNGTFVDPLSKKFPSAEPVPSRYLSEFKKLSEEFQAKLPTWNQIASASVSSGD